MVEVLPQGERHWCVLHYYIQSDAQTWEETYSPRWYVDIVMAHAKASPNCHMGYL